MALSTQPYKGARDFYPEDMRMQKYIFDTWSKVCERFGYEEYNAPIIEPFELYAAKTGEEIVNQQTYEFEDRGGRHVAIRPEMTPSVSRMVAARRQELPYPARWYSIPNLWRYERPQKGRLREHWQLNVDIFGVEGIEAEQELIMLASDIMREFGADDNMYCLRLNSRKMMDFVLNDYLALNTEQSHQIAKLIDRREKIEEKEFNAQAVDILKAAPNGHEIINKLEDVLNAKSCDKLPQYVKKHESVKELTQLLEKLEDAGVNNVSFDPCIMRGFDYYTDIVFELFDNDKENNRSLFGGGRYDGLVGMFGVDPLPTVGFGMGDVTLGNFLTAHNLVPKLSPKTELYVVLIGEVLDRAQKIVQELRDGGVNVAVDFSGNKVDKQIKSAVKNGVKYALFIGQDELANKQFNIKNLESGDEKNLTLPETICLIKDYDSK